MKENKNLRENRKNRNCLQNREVVMRMQGFRGNCDSKGKLGMCPSLAEPDSGGFPRSNVSRETWHESNIEIGLQYSSHRQQKVFWSSNFSKMLPRCGRVAHICEANLFESWFSITSRRQTKVFWSSNFSKMLARFRASSPDRCPQAAKSLCHAFGTRSGWWEKRQLFEAGRTRPLRLVKP